MTKDEMRASGPIHVSAAPAERDTMQQDDMNYQSSPREGSESDMATMDDMQFTAALDRLLDREVADASFTSDSAERPAARTVSADPSVASSASSVTTSALQQQQRRSAASTSYAAAPAGNVVTQAGQQTVQQQQQSRLPPASNTAFPQPLAPQRNPALTGMSPLTARLAFVGAPLSNPQVMPVTSLAPPAGAPNTSQFRKRHANTTLQRSGGKKRRGSEPLVVKEDDDEKARRRHERNMREQQRSQRITDQIKYMREILLQANVPCKPDKQSTLITLVDYITQLQNQSAMLDAEHKKLLDTIAKTNEMVNNPFYHATSDGSEQSPMTNELLSDTQRVPNAQLQDENAVFVNGLDYKSVFNHCAIALAVASIDGRFIDCNKEFEEISGYTRNELLPGEELSKTEISPEAVPSAASSSGPSEPPAKNLSLFNLLNREDMGQIFSAMSNMLKKAVVPAADGSVPEPHQDYWTGTVRQNRENSPSTLRMNISLVRTPGGRPKFFNCSLTAEDS